MDIPRALVITGIAVVSYLLIQAWQQLHGLASGKVQVHRAIVAVDGERSIEIYAFE